MSDSNKILRPLPQRAWQLTPASSSPNDPATPAEPQLTDEKATPSISAASRTRSILNLTSSTLFGIYQEQGAESVQQSTVATPSGTGAQTPAQTSSSPVFGEERRFPPAYLQDPIRSPTEIAFRKRKPIDFVGRTILLFAAGLGYGYFISSIHENPHITPVKVEGVDRKSWEYLVTWGIVGAIAGNLLPWFEIWLEGTDGQHVELKGVNGNGRNEGKAIVRNKGWSQDWSQPLRGIGVFIGIAYAIRRLPWESSSQAVLTLALVNPGLWYLIDGSRMGFIISTVLAFTGTLFFLGINPDLIPLPYGGIESNLTALERIQAHGVFSADTVGVFVWLASVIFCTVICFRSIGRRLVGLQESV